MTFNETGLHSALLQALADADYTAPTPVQAAAIPAALDGKDLIVSSQTGSGKTAAFMLPALHRLATATPAAPEALERTAEPVENKTRKHNNRENNRGGRRAPFTPAQPKILVLTPTRELALQVTAAAEKYGTHLRGLRTVAILGGMPYPKQLQLLAKNPDILVATPGRLIDHMGAGKIDFSQLQFLVLDEADRMLDMGFIEDIEHIVAATPASRQTLLFSATLDGLTGRMAQNITHDARTIRIDGGDGGNAAKKHEHIAQRLHFVDDLAHKNRLLDHLLRDANLNQAVVFTATKRDADTVAEQLSDAGFAAAPLHGDMHQGARNRTLNALRRGQLRILVATDVAARGIDVPGITHVFNYDLPKFPEDYVHRIGRTGRAGRGGIAVSLVNHAEGIHVKRIERFTRQAIPIDIVAGHEPKKSAPPPRKKKPVTGKPGKNPGAGKKPWYSEARRGEKKSDGNSDGAKKSYRGNDGKKAGGPKHGQRPQSQRSQGQRSYSSR